MRKRFWLITILLAVSVLPLVGGKKRAVVSGSATAGDLTCAASTTLESLAACVRTQMPKGAPNVFVVPNATEQAEWRGVVKRMMRGSCDFALPASLSGIMQIRTFTDSGNKRKYCVLMEVLDANSNGVVDRGWGTFVVYNDATRELSHQAPHPITDSTSEIQAITIFKETDSRSYLMAGAPRDANPANSACQSSFKEADAAHNTASMFHASNQELINWYGKASWYAIQWHGMAAETCPNTEVFPSHGVDVTPVATDKISILRNNVHVYHPAWKVDVPGAGACSLNATDNTQGRLINGVAAGSVCGTAASSYNGRFIHIEQDPDFRNPSDWINPVKDTWLAAPTNLTATAVGGRTIILNWNVSSGAQSYAVKRSRASGGPYKTVASHAIKPAYINTGLSPGITYYYVVTAANAAGESSNSNQASAKARF
jgi:hypothetical protein